ncbi:VPLPA-CTERM sorting domain-containing protein [Tropicibacter sp. S64]|uniref:VPLPA-CTERM sorting domain-containing protein n=1 Tax=Tropicibacter sp. S64 TaxID=3415122 RepID=UPI003C7D739B
MPSIQTCTVAQSGSYRIDAVGGQGGVRYVLGGTPQSFASWVEVGGLGGQVSGVFSLSQGTTLSILVGDWGQSTSDTYGAGGGGASGVAIGDGFQSWTVLALAGGGGGAGPATSGGQGGLSAGSDVDISAGVGGFRNGGGRSLEVNGGGGGSGTDVDGEGSRPALGSPYRPAVSLSGGAYGGLGDGYLSFGGFGGGGAGSAGGGGGGGGFYGGDGGYFNLSTNAFVPAFGGSSFLHESAQNGVVLPGAPFSMQDIARNEIPLFADVGTGLSPFASGSVQISFIGTLAAVPLPATLPMILAALGGLGFVRLRRRSG